MPPELHTWVQNALNDVITVCAETSHDHGESRVWRVETSGGAAYFVKAHRRAEKWHQEVFAYESVVPTAFGDIAPRLAAAREADDGYGCVSVLTALAGVPMAFAELSAAQEAGAWEAAGRWLAHLHDLPPAPTFGALWRGGAFRGSVSEGAAWMTANLQEVLARGAAANLLTNDEIALGHQALAQVGVFSGEPAVFCHRDYSPRNWLVSSDKGALCGIIDFEHSRYDVRAADLNRFFDHEFVGRPDREAAFRRGYGPERFTAKFQTQILLARAHIALGTIRWAREHGDAPFEAKGRAAAQRLIALVAESGW